MLVRTTVDTELYAPKPSQLILVVIALRSVESSAREGQLHSLVPVVAQSQSHVRGVYGGRRCRKPQIAVTTLLGHSTIGVKAATPHPVIGRGRKCTKYPYS